MKNQTYISDLPRFSERLVLGHAESEHGSRGAAVSDEIRNVHVVTEYTAHRHNQRQ